MPLHKKPVNARNQNGLFSTIVIILAVVIVLAFNLVIGQLPSRWTSFDLSGTKIYTLTDTTADYLAALEQDVTVTVLADKEAADSRIVTFLQRYADSCPRVSLEWVDPIAVPSVLTKYGCEANTVAVECAATGQRRLITFDEILVPDYYSYYYYGQEGYSEFDGEGQLTSAIDYVVSNISHKIYYTQNHGEAAIGSSALGALEKNHFVTEALSLLQSEAIPEDCDLLMVNAPASDFTSNECAMVSDYLKQGGKVQILLGESAFARPNLDALLSDYGIAIAAGFVGDTERYYPAAQSYFAFFPELDFSTGAAEGIASDALVLLINAYGVTVSDPARDSVTVTPFLSTSSSGLLLNEQDETAEGVYHLGVTAVEAIEEGVEASLTVTTTKLIDDEIAGQFGDSVANLTVFMNLVTGGFEDVSNISIEPKSLETPSNTIVNAGLWGLLFVGVLPLAVLALGAWRWWTRRRM